MTSWPEAEIWKDIPGYEGRYQVSDLGALRSKERGALRPFINQHGYAIATLSKEGQRIRTGVHRLVASAFIPNPEGKAQINHINGNKQDNRPENLEWATCSENNLHRRRVLNGGGGRPKKPVVCIDTGAVYDSITEAAKATGAPLEKILECCKGRRKKTHGLRWRYKEVEA